MAGRCNSLHTTPELPQLTLSGGGSEKSQSQRSRRRLVKWERVSSRGFRKVESALCLVDMKERANEDNIHAETQELYTHIRRGRGRAPIQAHIHSGKLRTSSPKGIDKQTFALSKALLYCDIATAVATGRRRSEGRASIPSNGGNEKKRESSLGQMQPIAACLRCKLVI